MLAQNLNKIASNFSGPPSYSDGPSHSFLLFMRERATEMAINGSTGMAFSMNDSLWNIDVVKASLPLLTRDGFDVKFLSVPHQLDSGEEGIEYVITVEWK